MLNPKSRQKEEIVLSAEAIALTPEKINEAGLGAAIAQILSDPIALSSLGDRVFTLLCEDLRQQQERYGCENTRIGGHC